MFVHSAPASPVDARQARENPREANRQTAIFNALPASIACLDSRGRIASVNDSWLRFGAANGMPDPNHPIGADYLELCDQAFGSSADGAREAGAGIRSVLAGDAEIFSFEYACHSPTERRWFLMTISPIADSQSGGAVVMHVDVTAKRQAEEDRRASETRFVQMAENINDVFFLESLDRSEIFYISPMYEKIWGRTCASLVADPRSWLESIHPDDLELALGTPGNEQTGFDYEYRIVRPDGEICWIHARGFPILDDTGSAYRLAGVCTDITQRKLAEIRLHDLNCHLERRVMQRTAELDARLLANIELARSLAGVNAQLTQEIEDRQHAQAERRASEARMHARETQSSRLEAIGTMAAGIAHDFNSILGVISGHAEMLEDDLPDHAPARQGLRQIIAASFRARDLIARMLAFARQMPTDPGLVCVVDATRSALEMVRVTLPPAVEMVFDTDLESARLMADPFQIQQIVMNLCINAGDAMEGRGRLTVALGPAPPARDAGSRVDRISLVVADNGCGMPPEVRSRVLEPFYTTKAPGEGSGLGLSVIYGIVMDLGGEIEIESAPGMGSQFRITLPLFDPAQKEL